MMMPFSTQGVLHWDISLGNIVYLEGGPGFLIDWDSCKVMDSTENVERGLECTVREHRYIDT